MRSILFLAVSALAAFAVAQSSENQFSVPEGGYEFEAGEPTTISWDPTTSGTVTIRLQKGDDITPNSGIVLGSNLPNSGSFSWTPNASLPPGSDYTLQIISDDDPDVYNFTPRFSVEGTTGTGSALPTGTGSSTRTTTRSSSSSRETDTTTTSSESSSSETTATATTTTSSRTRTTSATPTRSNTPDEEEDGAMALTLPTGLLSIVLALMALL